MECASHCNAFAGTSVTTAANLVTSILPRIDYVCWQVKSRTSSTRDSETPGCERHLVVRDSSPREVKGSQEVVQAEENEALDTKIK